MKPLPLCLFKPRTVFKKSKKDKRGSVGALGCSPIRASPLQRPCNASINKSSASHFCLIRVRIHSLCSPILVLLRWLTNRSHPDQCYASSSSASNSPIASTVRMTDFLSPVFRWRYTPSLFTALPLAPVRFLHVNVLLLFYLTVAVLFVLCLAICCLCSVLRLAPPVKF